MALTRQPHGVVRIDWGAALSRQLAFCAPLNPGGGLQDIVGGQLGSRTGLAAQSVQPNGVYPLFGTSNYLDFARNVRGVTDTTPTTIAWTQTPVSPAGYSTVLQWKPTGGTNNFLIYQAASDATYYFTAGPNSVGGGASFSSQIGAQTGGRTDRYVLILPEGAQIGADRSKYVLFANGVRLTTATTAAYGGSTSDAFRFGATTGGSDVFEGALGNLHIWGRALSDTEGAAWSRPGGEFLCYAPSRRVWVQLGPAAGGGAFELDAQPGGYSVSGTAATLARGLAINAAPATYAVSGTAASIVRGYNLNAATGTFAATGVAAGLLRALSVNAGPGTFSLTGVVAGLDKTTAGVYTLDAQPGTYSLTGVAATLVYTPINAYTLDAQPGTYTFTGVAAGLTYAGSSIWTDIGVSAATWSDIGGASSIWTDL
jgi:hypothetical protein